MHYKKSSLLNRSNNLFSILIEFITMPYLTLESFLEPGIKGLCGDMCAMLERAC